MVDTAFGSEAGGGEDGEVGDGFHAGISEFDSFGAGVADVHGGERILEAHETESDGAMFAVGVSGFVGGVVVDVDDIIEHPHGGADGLFEHVEFEPSVDDVCEEVDGAEVADGGFGGGGIEQDFGAEVAAVDDADVVLRGADVGGVFPGDPGVPGFEEAGEHFAPEFDGGDFAGHANFALFREFFVVEVAGFEAAADEIMQVGDFVGAEECPFAFFLNAFHEQVGDPVGGVHVVRAAAIVARVFAKIEEFFDVEVPGFEVGADGAFAFAALINGDGGVVDDFEEGDDALAASVGTADMCVGGADAGPVVTESTRPFAEFGVVGDAFEDVFEVVADGGEVAGAELGVIGGGVEESGGGGGEAEGGEQVIEFDGAFFGLFFAQRQPHGDSHPEVLGGFNPATFDVQEVAVVDGLESWVAEEGIAIGLQGGGEPGEVEGAEFRGEAIGVDAVDDVVFELVAVESGVFGGAGGGAAEGFVADDHPQQPGGDDVVGGIAFDAAAGGKDHGPVDFVDGDAVEHSFDDIFEEIVDVAFGEAVAGEVEAAADAVDVEGHAESIFEANVDPGNGGVASFDGIGLLERTNFGVFGAVDDIAAGDAIVSAFHELHFDEVLDLFDPDSSVGTGI